MITKNDFRFTERPSIFSENYIKQCEKAKEIQELCRYKKGDWFYTKKYKDDYTKGYHVISDDYIYFCDNPESISWITRAKGVWLPTQEQLQAMILPILKKRYNKAWDLNKMKRTANWVFRIFSCFLNEHSRIYSNDMNELWLAFVMKEKWNKKWTGKDWVELRSQP